jgi:hypothetical protein
MLEEAFEKHILDEENEDMILHWINPTLEFEIKSSNFKHAYMLNRNEIKELIESNFSITNEYVSFIADFWSFILKLTDKDNQTRILTRPYH